MAALSLRYVASPGRPTGRTELGPNANKYPAAVKTLGRAVSLPLDGRKEKWQGVEDGFFYCLFELVLPIYLSSFWDWALSGSDALHASVSLRAHHRRLP